MVERTKQELLPLSYRWVSPQNVEYYTKYECTRKSFPTENKINVFSAQDYKNISRFAFASQSCETEFSRRELATKLSKKQTMKYPLKL